MADFWLVKLSFVTLSILLGVLLFVVANTDFCGSVFETQIDHTLLGHVMAKDSVYDEFECQLKCIGNNRCKSFNVHPTGKTAKHICELNNKTRQTKPGDFKRKKGSTYYGSIKISCMDVSHQKNRQPKSGQCHPKYKGQHCQTPIEDLYSHQPAHSCKNIRDSGVSMKDGEYWIDPEKNGNPLKVFCDMTTDGGGWLLVSNFVHDGFNSKPTIETSYRGINSSMMVLTKKAMSELRTHLSFTQLRFHCSKQKGRTFHVTTVANSTGEAVVQYFSGQTDDQPDACGSFVRMGNDNSRLAEVCDIWGREKGVYKTGKWGHGQDQDRLYIFPAFTFGLYHWWISPGHAPYCDDNNHNRPAATVGDFWKVFVR